MANRSEFFDYVINAYYEKSSAEAAKKTGYTVARIDKWRTGALTPQKDTIDYFINVALVPEFKVIAEFHPFDHTDPVQTQLKKMLGSHKNVSGIYAFYDALGNLLYLGKATNLLAEIVSALNRAITVKFPSGIKATPKTRKEVVAYISAYDVGMSSQDDYPKHVESLILRISKPPFNKNIGTLNRAIKEPTAAR